MQKQEKQESKVDFHSLLKLLFITANEIAYPQHAPANTPQKLPPSNARKYGVFDYRNIADNQGWLPIKIDFTKFKPKKYYKEESEEVIQNHLKALQKHQNLLKCFKHYEDFDRIAHIQSKKSNTWQNQIEKILFGHACAILLVSRMILVNTYLQYFSYTMWRNTFKRLYFTTLPPLMIMMLFYPVASPVNHEYFRTSPLQIRYYQGMAYDADAYQYVNDMKYSFKYPERKNYYDIITAFFDKKNECKYSDAIKYYKKYYGIVQTDPYLKKNTQKNQQNTE